jgi:hypothetical protein
MALEVIALVIPRMRHLRRAARMSSNLAWEKTFDGRFEDRRYAIEVFNRWNEETISRRASARS